MLKSIVKSFNVQSNCLQHKNQVANHESLHGANSVPQTLQLVNRDDSIEIEEGMQCKCYHDIEDVKSVEEGVNVEAGHDANANANSTFLHAVINMVGMLIGLGQLSTPYAVQNGGWASSFLLIGLGVMCAYSSHLLGKCLERNPNLRSYVDIGHQAFGKKGSILAATFIYMEIFMALVSYTISLHDNLISVFLETHLNLHWAKLSTSQILTTVAMLIAVPSLWLRDLSSISFLSTCANHKIPVLQLHNIPSISGLYVFSLAGHIVFPDLYKAMKDPSKFTKVSIVSFTLVTILYTTLGFMGAKMFGSEVNPQITLSLPPKSIVSKIALWATVLTPMTKYALEFAPFAIQLEHKLPSSMSVRTKMIIRGSVGSFLLLVILVLALSVPYFQYVLSLTGSLVSIAICLILPCGFYTKIFWGHMPKTLLVLNLSLIGLGLFFGVIGTISSSKLLVKNFHGAS
ncbi:hypothetical protein L6164_012054 [Bauhinia variegata]|uniref:Uncharacterized protein n=1 Tax=Bauhinia variegata TaxID=167791 RepID=A0ACB9PA24_BAUVA|nr:hypothetical protein L6164_012054 [Bauhinia variegata]